MNCLQFRFNFHLQEENNQLVKTVDELTTKVKVLSNRLREHGLDDVVAKVEVVKDVATVIRKTQVYQGKAVVKIHFNRKLF